MDITIDPTNVSTGPAPNSLAAGALTETQVCRPGTCSSTAGPLEARLESIAGHIRPWTTTTWTTVYVRPSTTEHTRTTTRTAWTETMGSSISHKDPWTTDWVTETVGEAATLPSWTTIVTSPATTTTTTTATSTQAATPTETATSLLTSENFSSPRTFDFGFLAYVGICILAVSGLVAGIFWLMHVWRESVGEPVTRFVPVQVDTQRRDDVAQGSDGFYEKAYLGGEKRP